MLFGAFFSIHYIHTYTIFSYFLSYIFRRCDDLIIGKDKQYSFSYIAFQYCFPPMYILYIYIFFFNLYYPIHQNNVERVFTYY